MIFFPFSEACGGHPSFWARPSVSCLGSMARCLILTLPTRSTKVEVEPGVPASKAKHTVFPDLDIVGSLAAVIFFVPPNDLH